MQDGLETEIRRALIENRAQEISFFRASSKSYKDAIEDYLESSLPGHNYQTIRFLAAKLSTPGLIMKRSRSESRLIHENPLFLNTELFSDPNGFHSGVYRVLDDFDKKNIMLLAYKNNFVVNALHAAVEAEGGDIALSNDYVSNVTRQFYDDQIDFISYNAPGFLETNFMMLDVYEYLCGVKGVNKGVAAENLLASIKDSLDSGSGLKKVYNDYLFVKADNIWQASNKYIPAETHRAEHT